jgi:hypothetical protein
MEIFSELPLKHKFVINVFSITEMLLQYLALAYYPELVQSGIHLGRDSEVYTLLMVYNDTIRLYL